ncbi:MAG: hypothetical protein ABIP34_23535 [Rhodoferax sp.]|uniref:hypothetical protein n=1 Tax=Rhodoferax sp. TaxID=50421 RepID=UPI0032658590
MADFVMSMVRFLVRVVVLAMGLVFAASLLLVVVALAIMWGLSALWAKLTGQPMTPWVMRVNPRTGWSKASQAASRWQPYAKQSKGRSKADRDLADVTDVQVKDL